MDMNKTQVNLKVWATVRNRFKFLVALTSENYSEALNRLVLQDLERFPGAKDLQDQAISKQKE